MAMPKVILVEKGLSRKKGFTEKIKNFKMRNKIFIFLFFAVCIKTNAQKLDTALMLFKARVCLLEYSNINSNSELLDFFNRDLPFNFLNSRGFSSRLLFIEVPINFDSVSAYKFIFNYKFVFA